MFFLYKSVSCIILCAARVELQKMASFLRSAFPLHLFVTSFPSASLLMRCQQEFENQGYAFSWDVIQMCWWETRTDVFSH